MRIIQPISAFDATPETNRAADQKYNHEFGETSHSLHSSSGFAYNEMADITVNIVDPVAELQKNLAHLQDLQSRMKFMTREVRYLLKV